MSTLPVHSRRLLVASHRADLTFARLCRNAGDRAQCFRLIDAAASWRRTWQAMAGQFNG